MLYVDGRVGSKELEPFLRQWGAPYQITHLPYGDVLFEGNGPEGRVLVGVEIKTVSDCLDCICNGRFAGHQLPGLISTFHMSWLVIEGQYHCDPDGMLMHREGGRSVPFEKGIRKFMYRDFHGWLTSMEIMGHMKLRRTYSRMETARVILDLYHWWNKKWTDHHSHLEFYEPPVNGQIMLKPNLVTRWASYLPHVGWEKSHEVAKHFRTGLELAQADVARWQEIDGIGKGISNRVVKLIQEGE